MPRKTILLHIKDNVAVALTDLKKGEQVNASLDGISVDVVLLEDVSFGHKYALRDVAKGEEVIKYGMPIGKALSDVRAGEWVHVHNCRSQRYGFAQSAAWGFKGKAHHCQEVRSEHNSN